MDEQRRERIESLIWGIAAQGGRIPRWITVNALFTSVVLVSGLG